MGPSGAAKFTEFAGFNAGCGELRITARIRIVVQRINL
jgi:hypothetical protein